MRPNAPALPKPYEGVVVGAVNAPVVAVVPRVLNDGMVEVVGKADALKLVAAGTLNCVAAGA